MQLSKLDLYEILQGKLLEIPNLVTQIAQRHPAFLEQFLDWLKQTEEVLKLYTLPACAELAGLRSKVLAPMHHEVRRAHVRKAQVQVAAQVIYDAQNVVLEVAQPLAQRIDECQEVIGQMVAIILLQHRSYGELYVGDQFASVFWSTALKMPDLHNGVVKLRAAFTMPDIARLIEAQNRPEAQLQFYP
jgi:hypothetical protein